MTPHALMDRLREQGERLVQPRLLLVILACVTCVLVLGPLVVLIHTSLLPAGALPLSDAPLTLANYWIAFGQPDTYALVRNTTCYAGGSVALAVSLALGVAWLTERTDLPARNTIHALMYSWMAVPPLVMAFGWILLLNPNNGVVNIALKAILHLDQSPITIYSLSVMIVVSGLSMVPTIFVMLANILRNMDPQLENAGIAAGANRLTVLRRITLPLLSPSLLSVTIYMFMIMVQAFDVPLAIGLTARLPILSVRIYMLSSGSDAPPEYGISAALGVALMLFALMLMWGYFRLERTGERFRVVTGKAFRPRRFALRRLRPLAGAGVTLYFTAMLLPLLMLLWTSLQPFYRTPSLDALATLTLRHYREILTQPLFHQAALNTVVLAGGAATAAMSLAVLASWYAVRTKWRLAHWLDILAFMPIAVPHIVMAVAIMVLYLRTPIYGTLGVLILAHTGIYIAFATRTMHAGLLQIHRELESAAAVSGAGWATTLHHIVLPLLWPQFVSGWLWVVAHSARDLTIPLMLMSTSNVVISSLLWLTWEHPNVPQAAALAILLVLALMSLVFIVRQFVLRRLEHDSVAM